ncbi:oxidoreductase [Aquimarina sp. U1-2]|uniref:oxidoreductase n=1 Tax=Aquimarina sp. U1-2 TaxID=2823141 RepID=UPI001FED9E28|nr:oxidoreductase [Aquimarina sp. U1-2]
MVWFITGASTGFGKELAKVALSGGDKVVATFRNQEQIAAFNKYYPGQAVGVHVDVTKPEQVAGGIERAISEFGRIDVLVNNAGYGSLGSLEEVEEDELKYQFEVNVFGAVRLTKAVLPYMRKQRSGHIINITSIGGLVSYPGVSVYNGSKFALEGIGEALAMEVAHIGIKVTNIEPGPFRTDWAGRSASYQKVTIPDYEKSVGQRLESIKEIDGKQEGDPEKAAKAIFQVTRLNNPPLHLPLGASAYKDAYEKSENLRKELDSFQYLGLPTDFKMEK